MGFEFLLRVRKTSLITGLVLFPVITTYIDLGSAAAWGLGITWSLVNIYFIGLLVKAACSGAGKQRLRVVWLFLVKVPVLYLTGFLLLTSGRLPVIGLLAGFMWPLVVVVLKSSALVIGRITDKRKTSKRKTSFESRSNLVHKSR